MYYTNRNIYNKKYFSFLHMNEIHDLKKKKNKQNPAATHFWTYTYSSRNFFGISILINTTFENYFKNSYQKKKCTTTQTESRREKITRNI